MNPDQATMVLPSPLAPGARFGQYRIIDLLGTGGMGQVYRAVQGTLERTVALKVMRPELATDPQFADRFLREARAAASVCHQSVVVIFDAGELDGRLFMAFQFVPGGDLDAKLAGGRRFAAGPALDMIIGCCDGLQAIHEAGLVHRDIKPHNIFLDAQERPKLGDFGLARQAQGADRMTMTGVGMGTPSYMSPEQAQGLADIDIRADIHALGGTLYTLLTGRVPFPGPTPWVVVNAVCNEPAPDPRMVVPDLPEPVAAIVLRCMAKERGRRYATPADLRNDLVLVRAALAGATQGGTGPLPRPPAADRRPWHLEGWPWVAGTGAALAALPLALRPLLETNDQYQAAAWGSAWWAGWLSCVTGAALLVWAIVAPAPRPRRVLAIPWLGSAGAVGLGLGWAVAALVAAADGTGSPALTATPAILAALAAAGWQAARWWRADEALPGRALPRTLGLVAACTLVAVICHLAIADRPAATRTLKEETRSIGANLRRVFRPEEPPTSVPVARNTGAASAVAWLAPLTLCLVAPAWLSRRRRR